MEELSRHILYLLSRHDRVCVPGIGTFSAERRAARYNEATGRWLPPIRRFCFDASAVSDSDNKLAASFSRRLNVDLEEGTRQLLQATHALQQALAAGETYRIGMVGILKMANDTITFQQTQTPGQYAGLLGRHGVAVTFF